MTRRCAPALRGRDLRPTRSAPMPRFCPKQTLARTGMLTILVPNNLDEGTTMTNSVLPPALRGGRFLVAPWPPAPAQILALAILRRLGNG
jgi:hypothetical protein